MTVTRSLHGDSIIEDIDIQKLLAQSGIYTIHGYVHYKLTGLRNVVFAKRVADCGGVHRF